MKASVAPMTDELLELQLELRRAKPWHFADAGSIWEITGTYMNGQDTFTRCLAQVLPGSVTGTDAPIFELLVYGERDAVSAVNITAARELLLVKASDPLAAYYESDQAVIDEALTRRDENR